MREVSLCVMSRKGYAVLRDLISGGYTELIDKVIIAHDKNMVNDYYDEMYEACKNASISVHDKTENVCITSPICIAIAWRWIIPLREDTQLIVFHDSLLPKYRGFSPLVNMLINREPYIGVTALFASKEYDKGDIISQRRVEVSYPIKIIDAIDLVTPLYSEILFEIFKSIDNKEPLATYSQNEDECSYSLWRDDEDYHINWYETANQVQQFVYSVGYPFKGAYAIIEKEKIRIADCELVDDVFIENRQPGKIIFMDNGIPTIVCGKGLLKIKSAYNEQGQSFLPLKKFRIRFE